MCKIIISSVLLIFATINLIGQDFTITINQEVFENIDRSVVLLTNQDGIIIEELILKSSQIDSDVIFSSSELVKSDRLDLTIFNEYTLQEVNIGSQYFNACTHYNIKNGQTIKEFREVIEKHVKPESKLAAINVSDIQTFNSVEFYTGYGSEFERSKLKKEILKIKYEHVIGNDFCTTLFCNDAPNPKTIYIPENDLKLKMDYQWDNLNSDVSLIKIDLPFKEKWFVEASAINEETENRCLFFRTKTMEFIDNFSFYYPENRFFFDYKINLRTKLVNKNSDNPRYIYYHITGDLFNFEDLTVPDFYYDINFLDKKGFDITLDEKYNGFYISYKTLSYLPFQKNYNQGKQLVLSRWDVISDSNEKIEFTFPTLSHLTAEFQTIRSINYLKPGSIGVQNKTDDKLTQIVDYIIDKD